MRLASLHVYPIKSTRGFSPAAWRLDPLGLEFDRRWLVVRPDGEFITQRVEPRLALAQATIGDRLTVTAPGLDPLEVPLHSDPAADLLDVHIWEARLPAALVGPEADAWLARFLGYPARLVRLPESGGRTVDPRYATSARDRVAFTDAYPLLLLGAASLAELNTRLPQPLPMNRFRPNLVVNGSAPYAEDDWRRIRIGDVVLAIVKPCARCVITTTDQDTAAVGQEPLRTLATYRRSDGKVMFGQNVIHQGTGTLRAGETIEILEQ